MDKNTEQLYQERLKRIIDAVQLRVPDRVPVSIPLSYFPAKFAGVKASDAFYDFKTWKQACIKAALYLQPDRCATTFNQSGKVMEALDSKTMKWPGHGVDARHTHQFVEGEYMKPEEYDLLLHDMSDFLVRYYLPRTYGLLEPLAKLPPLNTLMRGLPFNELATPEFADILSKLSTIAREAVAWQEELSSLHKELNELGFPARSGLIGGGVPFDTISDFLRGMRGAMLDMYQRPDKLLEAIEMFSKIQLERIAAAPKATEFTLAFIALHRGADGFMSIKQFEKFYFPYLKQLVNALVDAGYTPDIFFEGDYTSRLEYLLELPRGKVLGLFDKSDMKRVKEVLGGHMCIAGNVPSSILQTGSPEDVKSYCKWLIDVAGKDGGFIMAPGCSVDEANPVNVKTMVDFTREYGRYA